MTEADKPQMRYYGVLACMLDKYGYRCTHACVHTEREYVIITVFHDKNIYANVPKCYICTRFIVRLVDYS